MVLTITTKSLPDTPRWELASLKLERPAAAFAEVMAAIEAIFVESSDADDIVTGNVRSMNNVD